MSRPPTNRSSQSKEAKEARNNSQHKENHSLEKSNITQSRVSESQSQQAKKQSRIQQEPLDRQKVIDQNCKLKSQIKQLLQSIDSILEKDQEKRQDDKKRLNQKESDEDILDLQDLLQTQEKEVLDNKLVIKTLQRQLENTYEINKIVDKENELKHKQSALLVLKEEEESLNKIIKNQREALNFLNNRQEYDQQLGEVKKSFAKAKELNRNLTEELQMSEKQLQKVREQNIMKQKKTQELDHQIKESKKKPLLKVTQYMIDQLEEEVTSLEKEKIDDEKQQRELLKKLEIEKHTRKIEMEKMAIKLGSMEKEIRLNKIIINESTRLMRIQLTEANNIETESDKKSVVPHKPNLMRRDKSQGANQVGRRQSLEKPPLKVIKDLEKEKVKEKDIVQENEKQKEHHKESSKEREIEKDKETEKEGKNDKDKDNHTNIEQNKQKENHETETHMDTEIDKTKEKEKKHNTSTLPVQVSEQILDEKIEENYTNDFEDDQSKPRTNQSIRDDGIQVKEKRESNLDQNEIRRESLPEDQLQEQNEESNSVYSKPSFMMKRKR